jgi:tetratricopeptide (TPR) repeat protein
MQERIIKQLTSFNRSLFSSQMLKFGNYKINYRHFKRKLYEEKLSTKAVSAAFAKPFSRKNVNYKVFLRLSAGIGLLSAFSFTDMTQDNNVFPHLHHLEVATHQLQKGDIHKFVLALLNLAAIYPQIQEAVKLLESEQYKKADSVLMSFFIDTVKKPELYFLLKGIIFNALKKPELAIPYFDKALQTKIPYIKACVNLHKSIALSKLDETSQEAADCLNNATKIKEDVIEYKECYTKITPYVNQYSEYKASSKENRVTLRIWTGTNSKEVGHASIETDKYYISFWPMGELKDLISRLDITTQLYFAPYLLSEGVPSKLNTLSEDVLLEGRLPDYRVSLDSLNPELINLAFEEFREKQCNWSLLPLPIISKNQNCSGLVSYLLDRGGLPPYLVVTRAERSQFVDFVTITAASSANVWAPLVSKVALLVPIIGPFLAAGFEFVPTLTTLTIGLSARELYRKAVTPEDIAKIATVAKFNETKQQSKENNMLSSDNRDEKKSVSSNNWVNVRLWNAKNREGESTNPIKVVAGQSGNVGHATVQTPTVYSSFWPSRTPTGIKEPVDSQHMPSPEHDIKAEGRQPKVEAVFYSLDAKAIEKEANKMNEEKTQYRLKIKEGGLKERPIGVENCTSSTHRLLVAGGITKLSPLCKNPSSLVSGFTPDNLEQCVVSAKQKELELYPETRQYKPKTLFQTGDNNPVSPVVSPPGIENSRTPQAGK